MSDNAAVPIGNSAPRAPSQHRWPQFSLRMLLAMTVILILGISHWSTSRDLYSTRAELNQLKRATGELIVRDPAQLHVRSVRTTVPREQAFLWRLYVPPGATYRLSIELNDLRPAFVGGPTSQSIPAQSEIVVTPGEWEVWYEYETYQDGDRWDTKMTIAATPDDTETTGSSLPAAAVPWVTSEWQKDFRIAGAYRTDSFAVDKPVDLLEVLAVPRQQDTQLDVPADAWKLKVRLTPAP